MALMQLNANVPQASGSVSKGGLATSALALGNKDYTPHVVQNLFVDEIKHQVPHNHLQKCQVEVTDKMRAILVDWLVDVHMKYKCRQETLFLAVPNLDRYLTVKPVEKKKLQLIGCVAMMLACKYEEIMPPEVRQFVHISANTYTKYEMLQMEQTMLTALKYRLTVPTAWQFLTTFNSEAQSAEQTRHATEYLAEQSLMLGAMVGFRPSVQAATCLYLARQALSVTGDASWARMATITGYSEQNLAPSIAVLDEHMVKVNKLRFVAIRKKYSQKVHGCIALKIYA